MNKSELITAMSEKTAISKKDTENLLSALIETIEDVVANGDKLQLIGFGTFEPRERAERKGRNPQTKEEITIPASVIPVFKAGNKFKEKVNKK